MRTSFFSIILAAAVIAPLAGASTKPPYTPNTSAATSTLAAPNMAVATSAQPVLQFPSTPEHMPRSRADRVPVAVAIPSVELNSPIQNMGVLPNGELDVPSGKTNNVGWYAAGTVPGDVGSAVFDAHVFAAFNRLDEVEAGEEILVKSADGEVQRFRVETAEVFKLKDLSPQYLFSRKDTKRLTLITCAGQLTADHSTYTHRLVVSAVLVE